MKKGEERKRINILPSILNLKEKGTTTRTKKNKKLKEKKFEEMLHLGKRCLSCS